MSLTCLAVAMLLTGPLLVVGTDAPHPEPDFIAETSQGKDVEIEVAEDEPLGEVVFFATEHLGTCMHYTPEPAREFGELGSRRFEYGMKGWQALGIYTLDEPGTHVFQCTDELEGGFALAATTIDAAPPRQLAWALLWLSTPLLFLAAAIIALGTFVRSRRERSASTAGN